MSDTTSIPGLEVIEMDVETIIFTAGPDDEDFNFDLGPMF